MGKEAEKMRKCGEELRPTSEAREYIKVEDKIREAMQNCLVHGRAPQLLVINPKVLWVLRGEFIKRVGINLDRFDEFLGMTIISSIRVPDFQIVDDRSWVDQIW